MELSKFGTLGLRDLIKGSAIAAGAVAVPAVAAILKTGRFPTQAELITIAGSALGAIGIYLGANFLTNSKNQFGKPEPQNNVGDISNIQK